MYIYIIFKIDDGQYDDDDDDGDDDDDPDFKNSYKLK